MTEDAILWRTMCASTTTFCARIPVPGLHLFPPRTFARSAEPQRPFRACRPYNLGSLIRSLDIEVDNRHRAWTTPWYRRDPAPHLNGEDNEQQVKEMVNLGIKEALLPKNLTVDQIHGLPEECGVYYFHNQKAMLGL